MKEPFEGESSVEILSRQKEESKIRFKRKYAATLNEQQRKKAYV